MEAGDSHGGAGSWRLGQGEVRKRLNCGGAALEEKSDGQTPCLRDVWQLVISGSHLEPGCVSPVMQPRKAAEWTGGFPLGQ